MAFYNPRKHKKASAVKAPSEKKNRKDSSPLKNIKNTVKDVTMSKRDSSKQDVNSDLDDKVNSVILPAVQEVQANATFLSPSNISASSHTDKKSKSKIDITSTNETSTKKPRKKSSLTARKSSSDVDSLDVAPPKSPITDVFSSESKKNNGIKKSIVDGYILAIHSKFC